ncbi:MAG: hypothetical protein ACMUEL_09405 [Flavobacteriales bacterium Tduv]
MGVIVDACIYSEAFCSQGISLPRSGRSEEEGKKQISQRKERVKKETQSGLDTQEKWLKKSGKLYYG